MNANELADVFNTYDEPHDWGTQAQAMLRQQQAEIEALKLQVKGYQQSTKHYRELREGFSSINELGFQQIELNAELLRKANEK